MYQLIRPLLFALEPEAAHRLTVRSLRCVPAWASRWMRARVRKQPVRVWGLAFDNPLGLAAGFDKNAECVEACLGLGFGFVEVGAVTPKPQAGNPRPRLFRIPEREALINRMGFNNVGIAGALPGLQKRRVPGIVGINIGKQKETPLEEAIQDYEAVLMLSYPWVDYATVNISSPNTEGLRTLQAAHRVENLCRHLKKQQSLLQHMHHRYVPILLKIAPDLTEVEVQAIVSVLLETGMDGLVIANTTVDRTAVMGCVHAEEAGGLSGRPLFTRLLSLLDCVQQGRQQTLPVMAVGGIASADDLTRVLNSGATLAAVYTALVYQGPGIVGRWLREFH
ncbi:MAG: dihydroorotate dehydrogenase (quinone) [Gammaproteobacteria bacterium RIFCSPHIGHO2_12_FULL_45_9]|nr:MAG: dihydroorotate dehydrogenase (quinone) [Gammaproteobacteria bacterium RIFCSPHIGHO2_12_FULL_45_9]